MTTTPLKPHTARLGRRQRRVERLRHPDAATSPSDLVMRPFLSERGFHH